MKKIYLGLLLAFLSLRIDGVDFIPEWISFILFYQGTQEVEAKSVWFQRVKYASIPLAVVYGISSGLQLLSAMGVYKITNPSTTYLTISVLVVIFTVVISTLVIFWLFKGFKAIEDETNWDLRADVLYRLCLALSIFTGILLLAGLYYGSYRIEGLIPLAYIVLFIWYVVEIYRSWKSYKEEAE